MSILSVMSDEMGNYTVSSISPISASIEMLESASPFTFYTMLIVFIIGIISIIGFIYKKIYPRIKKYIEEKHYDKVKNQIQKIIDEQQDKIDSEQKIEQPGYM